MGMKYIDGEMLKKAFLAGAKGLEAKKEWINELNVFPVPDGDTGTNMTMTIMSAAREVAAIEHPDMESLAKAISSGSLRGARGNSGVILSQLFRGFTKEIKTVDKITTTTLANSFVRATETAYKAVMKPKEGTILTVAKGMADKAVELVTETEDIIEFCQKVIEHGDYVLSQTPEMLPVLKQAGVVDSGGQGLMQVVKSALDCLMGKELDLSVEGVKSAAGVSGGAAVTDDFDIRFGYCTEFIVNLEKPYDEKSEHDFKGYLESIGDSIVVVSDDDIVKVHVHTNDPGLAIQKALTYGSLSRMKIDNMREEHQEKLIKDSEKLAAAQKEAKEKDAGPRKPYGFISVSVGEGLDEIFKGIGADYLIQGGQTMNPSTEDILRAIDATPAEIVFVFPNNKNIIMAAEQTIPLSETKQVIVVPTKNIPQGISAMLVFDTDAEAEENVTAMTEAISAVRAGQITYAARNSDFDGHRIKEGEFLALCEGKLTVNSRKCMDAVKKLAKEMVSEESAFATIIFGEGVSEDEAAKVEEIFRKENKNLEVTVINGGQPVYYYIISVE